MGHRIIKTGEVLPRRAAWTHPITKIQFPKNELQTASPERLSQIGVEYFEDPPAPAPMPPSYDDLRREEYHPIGDQLDAILKQFEKDRADGKVLLPALSAELDHWRSIKVKYPKPEIE
jgi:hypothetical protein